MGHENHIASANDFRQAAELDRRAHAERVVLPKSGLAMLLARPSMRWFLFHQRLPLSLAARAQGSVAAMSPSPNGGLTSSPNSGETRSPNGGETRSPNGGETPPLQKIDEARDLAEWVVALVEKTVVEPRLSLRPGPNEISPDWLPQEDVDFIIRYAVGEVVGGDGESGVGSRGSESVPTPDSLLPTRSSDLAAFRREREPSPDRAGGGDVSPVAVGPAEDGPDVFSD